MHSIHWATIFGNAGSFTVLAFLAGMAAVLFRDIRKKKPDTGKPEAKALYSGDLIEVTTANGITYMGTLVAVGMNAAGGFNIICASLPPAGPKS